MLPSTRHKTINQETLGAKVNKQQTRKSAKSKEKKQKRKEDAAKLALSIQNVAEANAVDDPMAALPAFKKFDRNGLCVTFETKKVKDIDQQIVDWAFQLTKDNMQTLYDKSEWGWKDRDKLEEMTDSRAWYLLGRDMEASPVAFIHFRFDMEDTEEVLYCYEIQLEKSVRRKGLGKFMMQILELLAHRYGMLKVMLTTFKHNPQACDFFINKLKYKVDEISPEPGVYEDDFSYLILSKTVPQRSPTKLLDSSVKDKGTNTPETTIGT